MKDRRLARASVVGVAAAVWLVVGAASVVAAQTAAKKTVAEVPTAGSPVVATVNGERITRQQVADEVLAEQTARLNSTKPEYVDRQRITAGAVGALALKKLAASGGAPITLTRAEVVDWLFKDKPQTVVGMVERMIQERVVAQKAKAAGFVATQPEIDARMKESIGMAREQLRLVGMSDKQILATVGFRDSALRRGVIIQILVEKLLQKDLDAKIGHPVGPADFVDASHILVKVNPPPDPAQKDKAWEEGLTRIKSLQEEISSKKKTFEDVAQSSSDDAASKFQKGSLGIFMRGMMVSEFDKAAFTQEPGKVSEPIKSQFGWHLIRVNRAGKDTTGPERAAVLKNYYRTSMQGYVLKLEREAKVTNTVAPPPQPQMGMPRD